MEVMAKIIICRLTPGCPIRQIRAVIQAPRPKKKMINPGITSSRRKRPNPNMNQNSSGLEEMIVIIMKNLILLARCCYMWSKDIIKIAENSNNN